MESGGAVSYSGVDLYVTGFGKFKGMPRNPTADLVEGLRAISAKSPHPRVELCFSDVLTVSVQQCDEALEKIKRTIVKQIKKRKEMEEEQSSGTSGERKILVICLGVDESASSFCIEKMARNYCNFPFPDEAGKSLKNQVLEA